jgi:hypothetical protein
MISKSRAAAWPALVARLVLVTILAFGVVAGISGAIACGESVPEAAPSVPIVPPPTPNVPATTQPLSLTYNPTCVNPSIILYDTPVGAPIQHQLCLSGTGTIELTTGTSPVGTFPGAQTLGQLPVPWPYAVASFTPGPFPGIFSHPTSGDGGCQTVICAPVAFAPGAGQTSLSGFSTGDLLSVYSLPSFHTSWSGLHVFATGDGEFQYYTGDAGAAPQAATMIPAMINAASGPKDLPLDFIWGGDKVC